MKQVLAAMLVLSAALSGAQDAGNAPAFEVASIKRTEGSRATGPIPPDRFIRRGTTLSLLLGYAYQMAEFQIDGGADWIRTTSFDVDAKAEGTPSVDQMRLMVRRLLTERFDLRVHTETREMPIYALVMARDDARLGERLRPSSIDCAAIIASRGPGYRPPDGPPRPGDPPSCVLMARMGGGSVTRIMQGAAISQFVRTLQGQTGRIVIDRTGLTGTYDIELETELPNVAELALLGAGTPREGLSLFTALQEQLGLKLESERGPVEILVIDGASLPTPN